VNETLCSPDVSPVIGYVNFEAISVAV